MKRKDILTLISKVKSEDVRKNVFFGTNNAKLKAQGIISFDLPQGHTCPFAGDCLKFCYAKRGNYGYPQVKNKYAFNYKESLLDSFVSKANESLQAVGWAKFVRIHSSGDFYNKKYILKWIEIINLNPNIVFYAYTKSIILFKDITLPSNFVLIQSEGTKKDSIYLNYDKPFARIFYDRNELADAIASGKWIDASKEDLNAIKGALTGKNVALFKH
jgi:hypothetical protein